MERPDGSITAPPATGLRHVLACRACGGRVRPELDLGEQPVRGHTGGAPLVVGLCSRCTLAQLTVEVPAALEPSTGLPRRAPGATGPVHLVDAIGRATAPVDLLRDLRGRLGPDDLLVLDELHVGALAASGAIREVRHARMLYPAARSLMSAVRTVGLELLDVGPGAEPERVRFTVGHAAGTREVSAAVWTMLADERRDGVGTATVLHRLGAGGRRATG